MSKALQTQRHIKAEELFDTYIDKSKDTVEATDGWTTEGNWMRRFYYVENEENPNGPTIRKHFEITFKENSNEPEWGWI